MREKRSENWICIEEYKGVPIIIGGDFNARTAEEGGTLTEYNTHTTSKDKIKNREGEEMLDKIREIGMYIINGGVTDRGGGEYTYLGGGGKSTIDYVITNEEGNEIVEEMEVGTNAESDHQPGPLFFRSRFFFPSPLPAFSNVISFKKLFTYNVLKNFTLKKY